MNTPLVLTESNNAIAVEPYIGTTSQSFKLWPQADGTIGIRNFYSNKAVTVSDTNIWLEPYNGNAYQSLKILEQADGSVTLYNAYSIQAITTADHLLQPKAMHSVNLNQRFRLADQSDGSIGIRKVERSVFTGTPDAFEAIKRAGNWFFNSFRQATGFHAEKNRPFQLEIICKTVSGQSNPKLWVGAPYANPDIAYAEPRLYPLKEGINTITDPGGGPIYLELTGEQNSANLSIVNGALSIPYWEHNITQPENFRDMLEAWHVTPNVELYSERALVTISRSAALAYLNNNNDLNPLMRTYEEIIDIGEKIIGIDGSSPLHTRAPMKYHLVLGNYGGVGDAHAGHGYTAYNADLAEEMTTAKDLEESYIIPHELGHQNQMLGYLMNDFVEVTNDITSLATQRKFNVRSLLLDKDGNGLDTWARVLKKLNTPEANIKNMPNLFEKLAVIEQLRLAFGDGFWSKMNKITREKWSSNGYFPEEQTAFDNFALFSCMAAQANLLEYFEAWHFPLSESAIQEIRRLDFPNPPVSVQTLREKVSSLESNRLPMKNLTGCTDSTETRNT